MSEKKTATGALDAIRRGAQQMVLNAHGRLAECKQRLDEGDFAAAQEAAAQLQDRLGHLAHAQLRLAALADARLLRCGDLRPGMKVAEDQIIATIEPCPCEAPDCTKMIVTFEDGAEVPMDPSWEVVVAED